MAGELLYPPDEGEGHEANDADRYDHVDKGDHRDIAEVCGWEPYYDGGAVNCRSIIDLSINDGVIRDGVVEHCEVPG